MYLTLFHATERAIGALTEAQQACEEMYVTAPEPEIIQMPGKEKNQDGER